MSFPPAFAQSLRRSVGSDKLNEWSMWHILSHSTDEGIVSVSGVVPCFHLWLSKMCWMQSVRHLPAKLPVARLDHRLFSHIGFSFTEKMKRHALTFLPMSILFNLISLTFGKCNWSLPSVPSTFQGIMEAFVWFTSKEQRGKSGNITGYTKRAGITGNFDTCFRQDYRTYHFCSEGLGMMKKSWVSHSLYKCSMVYWPCIGLSVRKWNI